MADYIDWSGKSGQIYRYWFIARVENIQSVGGNYMFVKRSGNGWVPIYIGIADDLRARLSNHERWDDAVKSGATHLMGHTTPAGTAQRLAEERDLIQHWCPVCNTHHKPAA